MKPLKFLVVLLICLVGSIQMQAHAQTPPTPPTVSDPIDHNQVQDDIQKYLESSKFAKFNKLVIGDPLQTLKALSKYPKDVGLPTYILTVASIMILIGFVLSVWRAVITDSGTAMRGAFANMMASAALIAGVFNFADTNVQWSFSKTMFQAWASSFDWSRDAFAKNIDQDMEEAHESISKLLGASLEVVSIIAVPEAMGAAKATMNGLIKAGEGVSTKVLLKDTGVAAGKAFVTKTSANMLSRMNAAYSMLQYVLMAFAGVVLVSGLSVMLSIYVLPIGLALINFGSSKTLWAIAGTFLGAWFTVLFMPLFLSISIELAFVKPAKAMEYYAEQMTFKYTNLREEALQMSMEANGMASDEIDQCISAVNADPNAAVSDDCNKFRASGWMDGLMAQVTDLINKNTDFINGLLVDIVNSLSAAFWGISLAIVGLLMGISIMLGAPVLFVTMLGGVTLQLSKR